jgi:hypothetical protein
LEQAGFASEGCHQIDRIQGAQMCAALHGSACLAGPVLLVVLVWVLVLVLVLVVRLAVFAVLWHWLLPPHQLLLAYDCSKIDQVYLDNMFPWSITIFTCKCFPLV